MLINVSVLLLNKSSAAMRVNLLDHSMRSIAKKLHIHETITPDSRLNFAFFALPALAFTLNFFFFIRETYMISAMMLPRTIVNMMPNKQVKILTKAEFIYGVSK